MGVISKGGIRGGGGGGGKKRPGRACQHCDSPVLYYVILTYLFTPVVNVPCTGKQVCWGPMLGTILNFYI